MRVFFLTITLFFFSTVFASVLITPDFSYVPFDRKAVVFFEPTGNLSFDVCLTDHICIQFSNFEIAVSARLFRFSRVEFSTRITPKTLTFYLQDRKTWLAFNHTTIGFDFSQRKSLIFSAILDSYGILPDEFVNLGVSIRQFEDGARILKGFMQIKFWNFGVITSVIYGGDKICETLFFLSF